MKRIYFAGVILTLTFVLLLSACGHDLVDDFWDDDNFGRNPVAVTVAGLSGLYDDARVRLTGSIEKELYHEKYQFSDTTGTVTLDIDYDVWRRSGIEPSSVQLPLSVEISGELDKERGYIEIDVNRIIKL